MYTIVTCKFSQSLIYVFLSMIRQSIMYLIACWVLMHLLLFLSNYVVYFLDLCHAWCECIFKCSIYMSLINLSFIALIITDKSQLAK